MPKREDLPYRDCVGTAVFNPEGLVFIGRRMPEGSADRTEVAAPWQMPQGGIDKGETPIEAAWRELFEGNLDPHRRAHRRSARVDLLRPAR